MWGKWWALVQVAVIAASAVLVISGWSVVVVVVVVVLFCCCIPYRLALMFAPTFAPCVLICTPYLLTLEPCACGVSLLSTGANIPLAQVVVVTSCNLCWWCSFIQPLLRKNIFRSMDSRVSMFTPQFRSVPAVIGMISVLEGTWRKPVMGG